MTTTAQTAPTLAATQNTGWGFWGTLGDQAQAGWALALVSIASATGFETDEARIFLDSRHGRHFADDVLNALHDGATMPLAITQATSQWMAWRIGRACSQRHGIPRGLPYLVGMVGQAAAHEQAS